MGQIGCLDLQIAKDGEDFGHGHLTPDFEDVEETWDVLLDVQLHTQGLKGHIFDPPHVIHVDVGGALEFGDALKEGVHVVDVVVEDLLSGVL